MVLLRGFVIWLIIALAESVHGALRGILLAPRLGDFRARQIAVFSGSVINLTIAIAFARWIRANSISQLLQVGLLWLVLMLGFEITVARVIVGAS
jgi:hypothetical protein